MKAITLKWYWNRHGRKKIAKKNIYICLYKQWKFVSVAFSRAIKINCIKKSGGGAGLMLNLRNFDLLFMTILESEKSKILMICFNLEKRFCFTLIFKISSFIQPIVTWKWMVYSNERFAIFTSEIFEIKTYISS